MVRYLSSNAQGALYMTLGSLASVINDGLVRVAIQEGVSAYQALFLRACGMIVVLSAVAFIRGERFDREILSNAMLLRTATEAVAAAMFFVAVVHIDFANAQTILMLIPFAVTVVAARLGEGVPGRRYLPVVVGLFGVMLVVRPTPDGFSPWSLVVLVAAALLVVREFATQRIDSTTTPESIALLAAIALTLLTGVMLPLTGWSSLSIDASVALLVSCLFLILAYIFAIEAVRVGDLSFSAPFRYSVVVSAVAVGFVMFDEVPDTPTLIGCGLVVLAGVAATVIESSGEKVPTATSAAGS